MLVIPRLRKKTVCPAPPGGIGSGGGTTSHASNDGGVGNSNPPFGVFPIASTIARIRG